MTYLYQHGHTTVQIGIVVVLLATLIVRQRFPWLQRLVGQQFHRWSSPIVIVSGSLVLFLGSLGFAEKEGDSIDDFPEALYETFQIFSFNVSHEQLAEGPLWYAMICAMILAVTLAAKGISFWFYDSSVRMLLLDASGHVVVCGLGRIGRQLIEDLLANNDRRRIVALEPDEDNHNLKWAREHGVITILGDATKRENLEDMGVARAGEVFLVTGSDESNIEAAVEIRKILKQRGRRSFWLRRRLPPLKCFVHVLDHDLALILREHTDSLERLSDTPQQGESVQNAVWDIEIFNALERTARRLLEDLGTSRFKGSSMRPSAESEVAHIVMLGFGEFGQTLALQLAEHAHFENCKRLRLTVCDREIKKTAEAFMARYVRFGPKQDSSADWKFDSAADNWASHTCRPLKAAELPKNQDDTDSKGIEYVCNAQYVEYTEATDDAFVTQLTNAFGHPTVKPAILVCFEDDRNNFALAERLHAKLKTLGKAWPIFVWIPRQRELSHLLAEKRNQQIASQQAQANPTISAGCDVIPFGQCYGSVSYREVTAGWTDWLARHVELVWQSPTISDSVKKLHAALNDPNRSERFSELDWKSLDKISQDLWMKKQEWARASNRSAAIHAVLKAAAVGRKIEGLAPEGQRQPVKITVSPELDETLRKMEHYRWVAERLISGWSYSPTSDEIRKTRWQILPWDDLDQSPTASTIAATTTSESVTTEEATPPQEPVPTSEANLESRESLDPSAAPEPPTGPSIGISSAEPAAVKSLEKTKDEKIVQFLLGLVESGILQTNEIEGSKSDGGNTDEP